MIVTHTLIDIEKIIYELGIVFCVTDLCPVASWELYASAKIYIYIYIGALYAQRVWWVSQVAARRGDCMAQSNCHYMVCLITPAYYLDVEHVECVICNPTVRIYVKIGIFVI